jgi:hypothetical protein
LSRSCFGNKKPRLVRGFLFAFSLFVQTWIPAKGAAEAGNDVLKKQATTE